MASLSALECEIYRRLCGAVSPGVCITPANKTPRRSHRLATRNCSRIDTPVRHALRSHVAKKAIAVILFFK